MMNNTTQKPSGNPDYKPAGDYIQKDWQRRDDNQRRWDDTQRQIDRPQR